MKRAQARRNPFAKLRYNAWRLALRVIAPIRPVFRLGLRVLMRRPEHVRGHVRRHGVRQRGRGPRQEQRRASSRKRGAHHRQSPNTNAGIAVKTIATKLRPASSSVANARKRVRSSSVLSWCGGGSPSICD